MMCVNVDVLSNLHWINIFYVQQWYSATTVNDGKCVSVITLKTATNMQKSKKRYESICANPLTKDVCVCFPSSGVNPLFTFCI